MNANSQLLTGAFRSLSARLGKDQLQVQGPGGNTSIKNDDVMWIKASGTELADAEEKEIFVLVDRKAAIAEAREKAGDGSCKGTVLDPKNTLRPSIETTFHAALNHSVVAHTHSVVTITHAISAEGRAELSKKLDGIQFVIVPYAKPGLPLTKEILARVTDETTVIILQNHGLICCGDSVEEVSDLIEEVENRLQMPFSMPSFTPSKGTHDQDYEWAEESWIAHDTIAQQRALAGTYYPDHVVFLGPSLPTDGASGSKPAFVVKDVGICLRKDATPSQRAMLRCLSDVLLRVPDDWSMDAIGIDAEAELLNWDAEKYRQALAAGS